MNLQNEVIRALTAGVHAAELAEAAGVSRATVDKVADGLNGFSASIHERLLRGLNKVVIDHGDKFGALTRARLQHRHADVAAQFPCRLRGPRDAEERDMCRERRRAFLIDGMGQELCLSCPWICAHIGPVRFPMPIFSTRSLKLFLITEAEKDWSVK